MRTTPGDKNRNRKLNARQLKAQHQRRMLFFAGYDAAAQTMASSIRPHVIVDTNNYTYTEERRVSFDNWEYAEDRVGK
jgi:hypothetical protein